MSFTHVNYLDYLCVCLPDQYYSLRLSTSLNYLTTTALASQHHTTARVFLGFAQISFLFATTHSEVLQKHLGIPQVIPNLHRHSSVIEATLMKQQRCYNLTRSNGNK